MVAAVHLEREPAEVAQPVLAQEQERPALAAQIARRGAAGLLENRPIAVQDTEVAGAADGQVAVGRQTQATG